MKKHRGWVRLTGTYPRCFFFVKEMFTNPSLTRRGFRLRHRKCEKSKKKSHESRKPLRRKDFRVHLFYQHMTRKPCNRNGCRVLSFFDEGVKQAAAMPVATVWLLSMMRCSRPSRTHKSLCPTLDNCASFCPRFVLLQRRLAAQVYSGSRIPAENFSAAGWIAGNACLRWLPHGLAELLACKAGRSAVR